MPQNQRQTYLFTLVSKCFVYSLLECSAKCSQTLDFQKQNGEIEMKQIEYDQLCRQWKELASHSDLNGFEGFEGFLGEYEATWNGPPRIDVFAKNVAYRKNTEKPFEPGNVVWLAINHLVQEEEPTYPALRGN